MPMPNKQITDGNYRYNFQGQEKDPETGMEAFELRLWDGRLGRWLSVDPAHQYASPYLGMGNNPISRIDPDGGSDSCEGCPTGPQVNGATAIGNDGGTYVYDDAIGGWSSGPQITITADFSHKSAYGNFDNANDFLSTSFEMGVQLADLDKYTDALSKNKFIYNFNGIEKTWKMNYFGGGNVSSNILNQAKISTRVLGGVGKGIKYGGNILAVLAIGSNEAQYRSGIISETKLYKGRLDAAAGILLPVAGLGIAPGNYLGEKYHKEITSEIVNSHTRVHNAVIKILNFFGIPASKEQAKNDF